MSLQTVDRCAAWTSWSVWNEVMLAGLQGKGPGACRHWHVQQYDTSHDDYWREHWRVRHYGMTPETMSHPGGIP